MTIINEMDRESITELAQTQLDQLELVLLESINIFSITSTAESARAATRRSKRKVPVSSIISHSGASNVTEKAGTSTRPGVPLRSPSVPTVSNPVPSSSGEESPLGIPPKQQKKRRKKRDQCSICGKIFTRKSDHESRIVVEHGTGYHCTIHNKSFKHKKGYIGNFKPSHGGPSATSTPRAPAALPGKIIPRWRTKERSNSTK